MKIRKIKTVKQLAKKEITDPWLKFLPIVVVVPPLLFSFYYVSTGRMLDELESRSTIDWLIGLIALLTPLLYILQLEQRTYSTNTDAKELLRLYRRLTGFFILLTPFVMMTVGNYPLEIYNALWRSGGNSPLFPEAVFTWGVVSMQIGLGLFILLLGSEKLFSPRALGKLALTLVLLPGAAFGCYMLSFFMNFAK